MKTLILGRGEVGTALAKVLEIYAPTSLEKGESADGAFDVMHVCFPYSEKFVEQVSDYERAYKPRHIVIHSTVPVGTSAKCGATHSPIRGQHPNLAEGIRTFVKFIGGPDASKVADYFRRAGLRVILYDKSETTELAKLLDTEYYRACIEFAQRSKALCDAHGLNFHEVYTLANESYNAGYLALGRPDYVRPVLQPIAGEIGGHCVLSNKALLDR